MYFLLLQHVIDPAKPTTMAIADSGATSQLVLTIVLPILSAVGAWIVRSMITKPAEKVEAYEKAEFIALRNDLNKLEVRTEARTQEWTHWREVQSERTAKLEFQMETLTKQVNEKLNEVSQKLSEMTNLVGRTREDVATLKSQMDQTIKKWTS